MGRRIPGLMAVPIEIMERERFAAENALDTERV